MKGSELGEAWDRAVARVNPEELGPAYEAFIRMVKPLGDIEGTILLAVPNDFTKQYIEGRLSKELTGALSQEMGRVVRIAVSVDPSLEYEIEDNVDEEPDLSRSENFPTPPIESGSIESVADARHQPFIEEDTQDSAASIGAPREFHPISDRNEFEPAGQPPATLANVSYRAPGERTGSHLNPKFVFDSFVIGPSNRFAHAAALAVSEAPARAYNPLFIYGDSGLGKTHLLHAIGHYAVSLYPHLRVKYVNSEEFTNEFISAILNGQRMEAFKRRYRGTDILLIDDIQFIQGRRETIEEFFHTFNALQNTGKQIVMTSDVPPKQLSGFEDRLLSRFQSGLVTDVQPPDLETRIAILQMKADADGIQVDRDVLEYIASRVSSNIRELHGSLLRVTAFAKLNHQALDLPLAQRSLKDLLSDPDDTEISVSLVMGQTAAFFGITIEQMCSSDRSRPIVEARQTAMYLCRELTDLSLPKIGEAFGGRDHTTVMYANKKIAASMVERRETYNNVTELTNRVKRKAREN
ncbi:chromosomal replication initiator protein DnaA [Actinomycetaceae bacterium MB13-C1-2]|nr:chromosomal replication initiator protein DnaA [Actinomycetaceae bacterium MB13-C1-2]